MSEYVIDANSNVFRRIYIVYHDGEEIGALTSSEAVQALANGAIVGNGEDEDVYWNDYLQPVEHEKFLEDSLQAVGYYKIEHETGELRKAVYTPDGWKAYDEI